MVTRVAVFAQAQAQAVAEAQSKTVNAGANVNAVTVAMPVLLLILAFNAIRHRGQAYGIFLGLAIGVSGANSWVGTLTTAVLTGLWEFIQQFVNVDPFK